MAQGSPALTAKLFEKNPQAFSAVGYRKAIEEASTGAFAQSRVWVILCDDIAIVVYDLATLRDTVSTQTLYTKPYEAQQALTNLHPLLLAPYQKKCKPR